jgi:hypothetical protein
MAPIRAMLSPSAQTAVSLQRITLSGGSGSAPDSGIEALKWRYGTNTTKGLTGIHFSDNASWPHQKSAAENS